MTASSQTLLSRVDRDTIPSVEDLFRVTAMHLRTLLVQRCGGDVPVRFRQAMASSLGEVLDRYHGRPGAAAGSFRLEPANLQGMILLEGPVIQCIVGLFMGDDMQGSESESTHRSLTRLDIRLTRRICEDVLSAMMQSSVISGVTAELLDVVPNPRSAQQLPRSTTVIEVTLDVGPAGSAFGSVSVVLPVQAAGVLWPKRDRPKPVESSHEGLMRVLPVRVDVVAELARLRMALAELNKIAVGTVIDLGPAAEVSLNVAGRQVLIGEAGEQDGVRSVRIERRADGSVPR